ncbi:MAG: hypothetical protein MZV63_19570 [Marinilabiliales bacterium]|nr:hypothetical protein [Marinilabiliales bacterium]
MKRTEAIILSMTRQERQQPRPAQRQPPPAHRQRLGHEGERRQSASSSSSPRCAR